MMLTQKEKNLLEDLKSEEKLCVEKYKKYSDAACDGKLKNLFSEIGSTEQGHYDTICKLLNGEMPSNQGSSSSSSQNASPNSVNTCEAECANSSSFENDKYLCQDALSTEKYVSSAYNTSIFEFKDENIRNTLNHIQKEEQQHGDKIYNYMQQNGMYN